MFERITSIDCTLIFLCSGENVCVSMFDSLALAFHTKFDSYGREPKVIIATGVNPKIVGGRRFLCIHTYNRQMHGRLYLFWTWYLLFFGSLSGRLFLNATSSTHLYFDSETAAGKKLFDTYVSWFYLEWLKFLILQVEQLLISSFGECICFPSPFSLPGHGAVPGESTSKVVHAQKIEPMTLSELNQFIITAESQVKSSSFIFKRGQFFVIKQTDVIFMTGLHLQSLTDNRVSLHR